MDSNKHDQVRAQSRAVAHMARAVAEVHDLRAHGVPDRMLDFVGDTLPLRPADEDGPVHEVALERPHPGGDHGM